MVTKSKQLTYSDCVQWMREAKRGQAHEAGYCDLPAEKAQTRARGILLLRSLTLRSSDLLLFHQWLTQIL